MPYADPDAQRAFQREWVRRRRQEALRGKTCLDCGSIDDLEFHHRDPKTKVAHSIWSWREEKRLAELAKCDVVCNECHDKRHFFLRGGLPEHGRIGRYKRGCRCEECMFANNYRVWRYRQSHRRK